MLSHPAFPWLQLPETLLMLWLTTLVHPRPAAARYNEFDLLYAILSVASLAAIAMIVSQTIRNSTATSAAPGSPLPAQPSMADHR